MLNSSKALYAGSFAPLTFGHLALIEVAAKLFPHGLIILVANNPKKSAHLQASVRKAIIEEACGHLPNVTVHIGSGSEFTAKVAETHGAKFLVRGIRSASDLEAERQMAHLNAKISPSIQTVFIPSPLQLEDISSSGLKSTININGWIDLAIQVAPSPSVRALIETKLKEEFLHIMGPESEPAWEDYKQTYTSRPYHNLEHILRSLQWVQTLSDLPTQDRNTLELAILYHDHVYSPTDSDHTNVDNSKLAFKNTVSRFLKTSVPTNITQVTDLIEVTKPGYLPLTPLEHLMRDIDHTILGAPELTYRRYQQAIAEEYRTVGVEKYRKGRTEWIQATLSQPQIFQSPQFKLLETPARLNLTRELTELLET